MSVAGRTPAAQVLSSRPPAPTAIARAVARTGQGTRRKAGGCGDTGRFSGRKARRLVTHDDVEHGQPYPCAVTACHFAPASVREFELNMKSVVPIGRGNTISERRAIPLVSKISEGRFGESGSAGTGDNRAFAGLSGIVDVALHVDRALPLSGEHLRRVDQLMSRHHPGTDRSAMHRDGRRLQQLNVNDARPRLLSSSPALPAPHGCCMAFAQHGHQRRRSNSPSPRY